ncbi:hypothetical protein [Streptomyces sp. A244]|uniref:hypothetical protein n=1 Tax=Streptomyces sp. A244 TaxID=2137016 RepID=UPI00215940E8|nr:hypothetical protein [Streptomyces sp. A244]
MKQTEPDFWVLEYVTITKDPRTDLVVAIGGTDKAADILQRTGGFLSAPGPRGDYHRLPHGLPIEQQRRKATAASHALLAAGHSVHLDPTLNMHVAPDGEREAALRYLAGLAERAAAATTSSEVAEVLTEVAAPAIRTPPPISNRLKPRLATALFRRYLRAFIPSGPDHASPLAGARPEAALAETQRVGHRHHH